MKYITFFVVMFFIIGIGIGKGYPPINNTGKGWGPETCWHLKRNMNSEFTSAGNIFVAELVNIASGYYTLDNIENIKGKQKKTHFPIPKGSPLTKGFKYIFFGTEPKNFTLGNCAHEAIILVFDDSLEYNQLKVLQKENSFFYRLKKMFFSLFKKGESDNKT